MSLTESLQEDMKTGMRSGDTLKRDTLRMVIAAVQNQAKDKRAPLTDQETTDVITREVKKRRESIDAYQKAGRDDLADGEQTEIEVLTPYLPEQLDEETVRGLVTKAVADSGATSARDMGKVMKLLMPEVKGRADGKLVSGLVVQELAKADLAAHDGHGPDEA
ncbi:MAG: GatB/YqeY domain-containing protein [Chloroflexota bacterium]